MLNIFPMNLFLPKRGDYSPHRIKASFLWESPLKILKNTLHKKWSFALRISSVNVTKSAGNSGFGQIYWRNPECKTSLFCAAAGISFYRSKIFKKFWNLASGYVINQIINAAFILII